MSKVDSVFIESTKPTISVVIGDKIVDNGGTVLDVVSIDYDSCTVVISENGNNYTIAFDTASCGDYKKLVN